MSPPMSTAVTSAKVMGKGDVSAVAKCRLLRSVSRKEEDSGQLPACSTTPICGVDRPCLVLGLNLN